MENLVNRSTQGTQKRALKRWLLMKKVLKISRRKGSKKVIYGKVTACIAVSGN